MTRVQKKTQALKCRTQGCSEHLNSPAGGGGEISVLLNPLSLSVSLNNAPSLCFLTENQIINLKMDHRILWPIF